MQINENKTMTNTIISRLAIGFATLGALFSTAFARPEVTNSPVAIATSSSKFTDYATIAKAPVSTGLKINQVHIFQGEINRKGLAVGYHHRPNGQDSNNVRLVKITGLPNNQGVYVGRVEIRNPANGQWISKASSSTFFPDRFSQSQVLTEIQGAFASVNKPEERWQAISPSGLKIEGFYSKKTNTITTAYPVYRR
jgi:hypothetical protein